MLISRSRRELRPGDAGDVESQGVVFDNVGAFWGHDANREIAFPGRGTRGGPRRGRDFLLRPLDLPGRGLPVYRAWYRQDAGGLNKACHALAEQTRIVRGGGKVFDEAGRAPL